MAQISTTFPQPAEGVGRQLLKIVALEPLHGFAISERLRQVSGGALQVSDGSLYPALHKLEQAGWLAAEWRESLPAGAALAAARAVLRGLAPAARWQASARWARNWAA